MTNEDFEAVVLSMRNVAGILTEFRRQAHPAYGGVAPLEFAADALGKEAVRLNASGASTLGTGLLTLITDIQEMTNV